MKKTAALAAFLIATIAWVAGAEEPKKPVGIHPAPLETMCSIMAGREDRAFLDCERAVQEGMRVRIEELGPGKFEIIFQSTGPLKGTFRRKTQ